MGAQKLKNEKLKLNEMKETAVSQVGGRRNHAGEVIRMISILLKSTVKVLFHLLFADVDLVIAVAPDRLPKKFEPRRDYRGENSKRFPGTF